ncbi:hypothetical protein CP965_00795 [Halarcobacter mediterraneus]|uniref:Uncharacterized protein n=1 Tax=Halarcobacter mediterraneus TaxID=2023153 RepID=A0A4Q1AWC5_9BACT|nr:hypothetical protein [Halarcobacter mediterraneus]RXK14018.1 hypothetical protein CP965_00795 [Halarcobacter mediterraneus]
MKKKYFIFLSIIILFLFIYYDNNKEVKETVNINDEPIYELINNETKKKIEDKVRLEIKENKIDETKKEDKFILKSAIDSKEKFLVQLIMKKKLDKNFLKRKDKDRYITISGHIQTNGDKSFFPMSLEDKYLELINQIFLELKNISTKETYRCEGYFLSDINPNYSYNILINLYKNKIECYIDSQSDNSYTYENRKKAKLLKTNKDIDKEYKIESIF